MKEVNFLIAGKLGDFTHALFAVKQYCLYNQTVANIYMVDIGWEYGIQNTHSELLPILETQDHIRSLHILTDYYLDPIQTPNKSTPIKVYNQKLIEEGYIDLCAYIRSPLLYKACWSEIFSNLCNFTIDAQNYKSISFKKKDPKFEGKIIIHRRTTSQNRLNHDFPWRDIVESYKDNIIFISTSEKDYEEFPFKDGVEFYKIGDLLDWYTTINSADFLVSNLSAPESMGKALDVPRLIELPYTIDAEHIIGEEKYTQNLYWYLNEKKNNCQNILKG